MVDVVVCAACKVHKVLSPGLVFYAPSQCSRYS